MLYPVLQDPLHPIVSSLFDRPRGASIGQMLFGAGEQGGWYDVSDMSTLFQDEAGATPVTAVEQPVGRILDKSGRGNHATQATTTKRPVLSRRRVPAGLLSPRLRACGSDAKRVGWPSRSRGAGGSAS